MGTRREYLNKKRRRRSDRKTWIIPAVSAAVIVILCVTGFVIWKNLKNRAAPEDTVKEYFLKLNEKKYEDMYGFLSDASKKTVSKDAFIERNQNIYEGIGAADIKVEFPGKESTSYKGTETVAYHTEMDTSAGNAAFDNQMTLVKNKEGVYKIEWDSTLIFPSLKEDYKVQVETRAAQRGSIYDRNGTALATQGTVSEVGLVPGKMGDDREADIQRIAELLDMTVEGIEKSLSASYVQEDTFVPLKKIAEGDTDKADQLLEIPGILINSVIERVYPLGALAGHLTGYIQSVTAEDMEELKGEGYHANSVIGRAGLELAYEKELRAVDGAEIYIADEEGRKIERIVSQGAQDGKDVYLTIDVDVQKAAYEEFASDPGAVAAMNPKTGEVLALVSTPGYDPNEFILGMSGRRWDELSNAGDKPLSNRFKSTWVPGSTFKVVTAAIGVDSGTLKPEENLGDVGLSWQKDSSWGNYYVTTLVGYGEPVNLERALIYSDNIYFARVALNIGGETLTDGFKKMGFGEKLPFEVNLVASTYDDDDKIDSDIQLADTGYGQGQLMVNLVHMLSMYSLFVNDGNMIQPTLSLEAEKQGCIWKEQAVSAETAQTVKNGLIQVIENPDGTGAEAKIEGITMLGKTGTAEIKENQGDTGGVERGWFICETVEDIEKPIAVVGMVEDVKDKGGSHYVTGKVRNIVSAYEGR